MMNFKLGSARFHESKESRKQMVFFAIRRMFFKKRTRDLENSIEKKKRFKIGGRVQFKILKVNIKKGNEN